MLEQAHHADISTQGRHPTFDGYGDHHGDDGVPMKKSDKNIQ